VAIDVDALATKKWKNILSDCSSSITSLMDLLQGNLDEGVMKRLVLEKDGLFPGVNEFKMSCSCPD